MKTIGRNDPCPCGSGKKFKKCHMGREDELELDATEEITPTMSATITGLPEVSYGRSTEIAQALDLRELTGNAMGIKFVDLKAYSDLDLAGGSHKKASEGRGGGVFINLFKTMKSDPHNAYLAISRDIDDSTLIHQIAHVLDYLAGSKLMPGTLGPLSFELDVPVDHLEHTEEFGYWLNYLRDRFEVTLDADDRIITYLCDHGMLLKGQEIQENNRLIVKSKSDRIFRFLSERSREINELIQNLPGYLGPQRPRD